MSDHDLTRLLVWTGIGIAVAWTVTLYLLAWVRRDAAEREFWETYHD